MTYLSNKVVLNQNLFTFIWRITMKLTLRAFDWYIISMLFSQTREVGLSYSRIKKIFSVSEYKNFKRLHERINDIISVIPIQNIGIDKIPHIFTFNQNSIIRNNLKQILIGSVFSQKEIDVIVLIIEISMKNLLNMFGINDLKYIYCWETVIEDIVDTLDSIKSSNITYYNKTDKCYISERHLNFEKSESQILCNRFNNPPSNNVIEEENSRIIRIQDVDFIFKKIPKGSFISGARNESGYYLDEIEREVVIDSDYWMLDSLITMRKLLPISSKIPSIRKEFDITIKNFSYSGVHLDMEEMLDLPIDLSRRQSILVCRLLNSFLVEKGEVLGLPSEEQWEYAALAGRQYSEMNCKDYILNNCWVMENIQNSENYPDVRRYPHLKGEKQANPWGLYDMQGNMYEWTSTKYHHPILDDKESFRFKQTYVAKGGSFYDVWNQARTSFRMPMYEFCNVRVGLRPILVAT